MLLNMIKFNKNIGKSAALTLSFLITDVPASFAQNCNNLSNNLGDVTTDITCEISNAPTLFSSVAYILGIGFTIAGLLKMKEFVDDPARSFMKDALIRLGVGALLILLPYAITVSSNTLGADPNGNLNVEVQDLTAFTKAK